MCYGAISEDPFMLVFCPGKNQRMCDEAGDDSLAGFKFLLDWFFTSKMIKKLLTALYAVENILYFYENSGDDMFSCNEIDILNIDLKNINFGDTNYNEDDPETIIHVKLLAWHIKFEKCKALKKN